MKETTSWTLFSSNEEAWDAMLKDCAGAQKSIVLEQFIFVNDEFGNKLINVCAERAAAGIDVRFIWDAAGSFSFLGKGTADELRKRGIKLAFWKTLVPSYFKVSDYRSWYFRNHRRTLVIDGEIGYTGSICIRDSMKNWRDTNARLVGPVVREMSSSVERMWLRAHGESRLPKRLYENDPEFRYITNQPRPGRRHINTEIVDAIRKAQRFIYITTAYFVPTHRITHSLILAAKRDVDVCLILPEHSDFYLVDLGARSYFTTLLKAGVRIFLYTGNMIHSKVMTIDDMWATVGSLNLDRASLLYNYEANIISYNPKFSEELASHFIHDLAECKEVRLDEWKQRFFLEKIMENLVRVIRHFL